MGCEGCKAVCITRYQNNYAFYNRGIPFKTFVEKCPCSNCLVKVACEDICRKYYLYVTGGKVPKNTLISRFVEVDDWTYMYSWNEQGRQPGLCGRSFRKGKESKGELFK